MYRLLPLLLLIGSVSAEPRDAPLQPQTLSVGGEPHTAQLPPDLHLEVLTEDLDGPRLLTFAPNGDLFIGSKSGHVYRLPPPYTEPQVFARLDNYPHSVAFRQGEILIARTGGLYRAPYEPGQTRLNSDRLARLAPLPGGGGHTSRTVKVGPEGRIYLGLGISGNCSDQYLGPAYGFEDRRGGILVLDEQSDPPRWQTYASGLRNPIGFAWHPETQILYASNNGPDHWGYEEPPEYFSRIAPDSFHGMPWFQYVDGRLQRDECIDSNPPRPRSEVVLPAATFPARNAPMDVGFLPATWGSDYAHDAVVALHGSWATRPFGGFVGPPASRRPPELVKVRFEDGRPGEVTHLVTGFQQEDGERWARPMGLAVGPDGALYFTSDGGNHALFRLRLKENR